MDKNMKKTVLLGVTGGIAAYKACQTASDLVKKGYSVQTVMTENACRFVRPLTFEALTGRRCVTEMFDRNFDYEIDHVSFAKEADAVLIAPATANVIAKLAAGIADDMLTTTVLAAECPKLVAPAMNTAMLRNPATQENLEVLKRRGFIVIPPSSGRLACGDEGEGRLPDPSILVAYTEHALRTPKDLAGLRVLVTAGPTREALDPVRFLTNRSTGKMGYAVAKAAADRGACVTLVAGPTGLPDLPFVRMIRVESAKEMFDAVTAEAASQDIIVKAAAVADFRPARKEDQKIKKTGSVASLLLERTDDILAWLGENRKEGQLLAGFSMETENILANAQAKLEKKNVDLIAANNVTEEGAGFAVDTNVLTLITRKGTKALPLLSKEDAAHALLDTLLSLKDSVVC